MKRFKASRTSSKLVFPVVGAVEWAARYNLSLEPRACLKCGNLQHPTIPFATSGWRGLLSPLHECGESYQLSVARQADPEENEKWVQAFSALKQSLSSDEE